MEFAKDMEFISDFVYRTKENIKFDHPYEITQLINSLVGLLILPKEKYYDNIQNNMIDVELLNTLRQCISIPRKSNRCSLKCIIRHMRNALAHFHLECKANIETRQVDHIIFQDFRIGEKYSPCFEIKLPTILLEQFVIQFSDAVSNSIKANDTNTK